MKQLTQFSFGQLTGPGDRNASMERQRALIEQGRLGSVINVMGAKITNELQRIARNSTFAAWHPLAPPEHARPLVGVDIPGAARPAPF